MRKFLMMVSFLTAVLIVQIAMAKSKAAQGIDDEGDGVIDDGTIEKIFQGGTSNYESFKRLYIEPNGTVTFLLTNSAKYIIDVAFYSATRVGWVYPSPGDAFILNDRVEQVIKLGCVVGEKICYGGFLSNMQKQWGAGRGGKLSCTSCCLTCGSPEQNVSKSWNLTD